MDDLVSVCEECGSQDIEQLEWRKVNTNEFCGIFDAEDTSSQWCCQCEKHVSFSTKQEYLNKNKGV